MALIGGCRAAERRVVEICDRFGRDTFAAACDALLERTRDAMARLIREYIPEEQVSFTDWVDDDGLGNGPFKMVLTVWREGDVCHADWTGTDDQAPGSINFHIHEGLCKLFFGIYMIMAFDPQILFNDGLYDVFEVTLPEGSLLNPRSRRRCRTASTSTPASSTARAARSGRRPRSCRWPPATARARCSCSPGSTTAGEYFQFVELLFGGHPRPADRRRPRRSLLVADVPHHAGRVHRELLPGRDRALRAGARLGRRRACTAAGPASRRCTCSPAPASSPSTTTAR